MPVAIHIRVSPYASSLPSKVYLTKWIVKANESTEPTLPTPTGL